MLFPETDLIVPMGRAELGAWARAADRKAVIIAPAATNKAARSKILFGCGLQITIGLFTPPELFRMTRPDGWIVAPVLRARPSTRRIIFRRFRTRKPFQGLHRGKYRKSLSGTLPYRFHALPARL